MGITRNDASFTATIERLLMLRAEEIQGMQANLRAVNVRNWMRPHDQWGLNTQVGHIQRLLPRLYGYESS
jgi:hypothetical protein